MMAAGQLARTTVGRWRTYPTEKPRGYGHETKQFETGSHHRARPKRNGETELTVCRRWGTGTNSGDLWLCTQNRHERRKPIPLFLRERSLRKIRIHSFSQSHAARMKAPRACAHAWTGGLHVVTLTAFNPHWTMLSRGDGDHKLPMHL